MIIAAVIILFIVITFLWSLCVMAGLENNIEGVDEPRSYHHDNRKHKK